MDLSIRARAFAIESEARQAADPATAVNLLAARCAQLESAARAEKDRADRWHARSIELGEDLERARRALAELSDCSNCRRHGTPTRVQHCGPGCHEAHTYESPCALAVSDQRLDVPVEHRPTLATPDGPVG